MKHVFAQAQEMCIPSFLDFLCSFQALWRRQHPNSVHLGEIATFCLSLKCPEGPGKCRQGQGQMNVAKGHSLVCFPHFKGCLLPASVCFCSLLSPSNHPSQYLIQSLPLLLAGKLVQLKQLCHGPKQIF